MPYKQELTTKRYALRKWRKKTAMARKRRAQQRQATSRIYLPLGGFPNKLLARLRYCQTFQLNPGIGGIAVQEFRANSIYDPDKSGTGHQPSNRDRLIGTNGLYDRYTVLGSKATVFTDVFQGVATGTPGLLALHLSQDGQDMATAHASGGVDNVCEQPHTARSVKHLLYANTGAPYKLKRHFSAQKFFGIDKKLVGMTPYSSDAETNPAEGAFFEVAYMSNDDSADPTAKTFQIQIDYIVMFTEPKLADAS